MPRTFVLAFLLASFGCTNERVVAAPPDSIPPIDTEDTEDTKDPNESDQWPDAPHVDPNPTGDTGPTSPQYVEIDAYLAYDPTTVNQSYDNLVGRLGSYTIDGDERVIPSQIVFTFWTETEYVCHVAASVNRPADPYDAVTDYWDFGEEGNYGGITLWPSGVLSEWSTCDVSDNQAWLDWFESWETFRFGFETEGNTETNGMVDGLIQTGDWTYTSDRAGFAYNLNSAGHAGAAVIGDWDYSNRMVLVSDGQYKTPLE